MPLIRMTAKLSRERWGPDRPVTGDSLTHPTEVEKTAHNTVRLPQGPGKRVVSWVVCCFDIELCELIVYFGE